MTTEVFFTIQIPSVKLIYNKFIPATVPYISLIKHLHQCGQFLGRVRVPEVDPPAGAAEGRGGEQRSVGWEVTGGQKVQVLMGASGEVPDEDVWAQTPQTHHLITSRRITCWVTAYWQRCLKAQDWLSESPRDSKLTNMCDSYLIVKPSLPSTLLCSWQRVKLTVLQEWEELLWCLQMSPKQGEQEQTNQQLTSKLHWSVGCVDRSGRATSRRELAPSLVQKQQQ